MSQQLFNAGKGEKEREREREREEFVSSGLRFSFSLLRLHFEEELCKRKSTNK